MAQFAPYTQTPYEPNYLGLSKTPDAMKPNTGLGTAISNVGEMFETGIKVTDEIQKKDLEREAGAAFAAAQQSELAELKGIHSTFSGGNVPRSGVSTETPGPVADEFSSQRKGGAPEAAEEPLPPSATRGLDHLKKIQQLGINNKMTGAGVQMNGDAVLSDLLQRYPARAAQIRTIASRYGFGEGRAQAQLRSEINGFIAGAASKDAKNETWDNTNRDTLIGTKDQPGIMPSYFNIPREQRWAPEFRDQLQQRIGSFEAIKKFNETEKSSIELKHARDQDVTRDVERYETNRLQTDLGVRFSGLMDSMGFRGVNTVDEFQEAWKKSPLRNDPKAVTAVDARFQEFITSVKDKWTRDALNTSIGKKGDTVLSMLQKEKLDKMHDNALSSISLLRGAFAAKEGGFNVGAVAAREAEGMLNIQHRQIYTDMPIAMRLNLLRKDFGENITFGLYGEKGSTFRQPIDKGAQAIVDGLPPAIVTGARDSKTQQPITIMDTLHDYTNKWRIADQPKPQDVAAILDTAKRNILNVNLPQDWSIAHANYVFSDPKLFAQLKGADKQKFLNEYANTNVSDRIFNLGDPKLMENYKSFLQRAVVATAHENVSNYKDNIQSTSALQGTSMGKYDVTQYYDLSFDPKSNRVVLNRQPDAAILEAVRSSIPKGGFSTPDQMAPYGFIRKQLQDVKKFTDSMNETLAIIDPVLKHEKTTIAPELMGILQSMGVKIKQDESNAHPLTGKPIVQNSDGSVSTERTITVGIDDKFYNIPTIVNGKQVDNPTAVSMYKAGLNPAVGSFDTMGEAETAAKARSKHLGETLGPRSDAGSNDQVADITNINPATLQMKPPVKSTIDPRYPTGVKINSRLGFADEELPEAGNVGSVDNWLMNPAGAIKPPVVAQGGSKKKGSSNLSDTQMDLQNIKVDDIPEGMSARDFIKQLQDKAKPGKQSKSRADDMEFSSQRRKTGGMEDYQLDPTDYFSNHPEGFNDQPTREQRLREGTTTHQRLKNQEKRMEEDLNATNDYSNKPPRPQDIQLTKKERKAYEMLGGPLDPNQPVTPLEDLKVGEEGNFAQHYKSYIKAGISKENSIKLIVQNIIDSYGVTKEEAEAIFRKHTGV